MPPGGFALPPEALAALAPVAELVGDANDPVRAAEDTMRSNRPTDPHFYLQGLGVDPPRQGEGLGSAVIGPVLRRCDANGNPAYLETAKDRNVGFYERHGFAVVGQARLPLAGPRMWFMRREPNRG
jgi:GNAT superfamily N-acetyltransferase